MPHSFNNQFHRVLNCIFIIVISIFVASGTLYKSYYFFNSEPESSKGTSLLVIGLIAIIAGFISVIKLIKHLKPLRRAQDLKDRFPNRPWKHDIRWDGFKNPSLNRPGELLDFWYMGGIIFLMIFVSIMLAGFDKLVTETELKASGAILLFLCVLPAVYKTLQYLKFSSATMILQQTPIVPGKTFKAVVILPENIKTIASINLKLFCEKTYTIRRAGKYREMNEIIYKKEKTTAAAKTKTASNRSVVSLEFAIPKGAQPDKPDKEPTYEWKVELIADIPGIDYQTQFALPVFNLEDDNLIEYLSDKRLQEIYLS
ncbi:MAG: hypothetical protein ACQETH_12890 [Candidatus Rifleibacteriota bacterium]